jgi:imidazolonepropionase-like amidohydrolase
MLPHLSAALALSASLLAQGPLDPPANGPRQVEPGWHLLSNATIHTAPGQTIDGASVYIKDGRIETVLRPQDSQAALADGYRVWDCTGLHIYPGFIDAYVEVDAPRPPRDAPGLHWNNRVTPQRSALDGPGLAPDAADNLRKLGFAAAAIAPKGPGIFRGTSAVVSLAKPDDNLSAARPPVYLDAPYHTLAFDTTAIDAPPRGAPADSTRWTGYPNSEMGAIALIRQTLIDADWQAQARAADAVIEPNGLDALQRTLPSQMTPARPVPLMFSTGDELESLRAIKIAREFNRTPVLLGSGVEFRRLAALQEACVGEQPVPIILPLNFPKPPNVASLGAAESTDLRDLMTWEQAPTNPRRLDEAGLTVALTTSKLGKGQKFDESLRTALRHGLKPDRALAMLTTTPAAMLGVSDHLGTIEQGKVANLIVSDGDLFQAWPERDASGEKKKAPKIRDLWVDGRRHEISAPADTSLTGSWQAHEFDGQASDDADGPILVITDGPAVTIHVGDKKTKATNVRIDRGQLDYTYDNSAFGSSGVWTDRCTLAGNELVCSSLTPAGTVHRWKARRVDPPAQEGKQEPKPDEASERERQAIAAIPETYGYPFGPYSVTELPPQESVLFTDVTLWTSTGDGIIENGWIMVSAGKIAALGGGPSPRTDDSVKVVALAGKHLTPGLIDAHSHTGISGGVNESGQAVTAEVRIQDVTNPDSINWYRQLGGGITTVNSMHGSANAIGGQTQTNKVRWGAVRPDDMHFEDARPGIKFALGENVKQSHWGDTNVTRYPQTRMGVEALFRDRFQVAKEYMYGMGNAAALRRQKERVEEMKERGRPPAEDEATGASSIPPRRDLELEALAEILAGERGIQCHSYRQDEILALCRIADEFEFKLGAWQHGLECYKVAKEVGQHAIGASLFSDWWNYKVEVQDAIPQAGPILWEQGVNISYNSDSDELARRMNTEAAKAVKYSSPEDPIAPEEALKFVTINPAKQLGIESRVGSLEVGKDADLAIWSGPPLSSLSRCEETWIDGRCYFSLEKDAQARKQIAAERQRIIQKILAVSTPSEKTKPEEAKEPEGPEADPRQAYYRASVRERYLDLLRRGIDPANSVCGDCGMSQTQQRP